MLTQTYTMAGTGQTARLEMPDLLRLAEGDVELPNEAQLDIFRLLYGASGTAIEPMAELSYYRAHSRSLVALACLVQVEPRVVMAPEDAVEGAVHYRALTWADLSLIYSFFRFGPPINLPAAAHPEPGDGATAVPPGDGAESRAE